MLESAESQRPRENAPDLASELRNLLDELRHARSRFTGQQLIQEKDDYYRIVLRNIEQVLFLYDQTKGEKKIKPEQVKNFKANVQNLIADMNEVCSWETDSSKLVN